MVDRNNWMKNVDDNVIISKLTLPGTHNAAACHTALPSVKCQGASVTDQLENGVRFLDVRVAKQFLKDGEDAKDVQVIHGKFPVRIPFPLLLKSVLDEVYDFLRKNDSEVVILSIKQEGPNNWDNDHDEFGKCIWDRYIKDNQDKWYLKNEVPKLGDARGKVMLLRRFGLKDSPDMMDKFGLDAAVWKYNCTEDDRGSFVVQDFCEVQNTDDVNKKVGYVKDLAKKAVEYNSSNDDPKLFINFCSGANFFDHDCWPEQVAKQMTDGNIQECFDKGAGIIVLDYSEKNDWDLVKQLIDKNF